MKASFSTLSMTGLSIALLLAACDKPKDSADGDTGTAADTKKDDMKKDAKKDAQSGGDMKDVCEKICDKAVACAADMAKASGAPEDVVKTASEEAKKGLGECKKGCADDTAKATDKDKAQVSKVKECISKDCSEYMKCMEGIE